ncbi:MAG: protein translocase subunit SecD [Anaerolineales bacterium]|nr:protein translocase subunit SecD [Anaerolineales bacterium]
MARKLHTRLLIILLLLALIVWVDVSNRLVIPNPFRPGETLVDRDVSPRLGLDLRGGLQVVMEADLPANAEISADQMEVARTILENRTNALGVAENQITVAGDRRIVGEFPGVQDSSSVLDTIQQTGLLEFVDFGTTSMPEGTPVLTDFAGTPENPEQGQVVYHTVMTGSALRTVQVQADPTTNVIFIAFELTADGADIFASHTTQHVGEYLGIVLDGQVISSPGINEPITGGQGIIQGSFTRESANALAVQLRYGSLPIPLTIVETRIIGPTLGEDSLQKSLVAGLIGMIIVILFMGLYYRLPGIVADIAILFYAALAFAVFKYFHVTLTLAGIAGFLLSTGSALDANILVFERIKEELRSGMNLATAVDKGWKRAWSSIRDANIATIITSLILFWFGSTFGATIVKGFSITLLIGVAISLFTALFVTRNLLALTLQWFKIKNFARWFGI